MLTEIDRRILWTSRSQGGAVSRDQVLALGFTRRQVDHRVHRGHWQSVGRVGYRILPADDHIDLVRGAVALLPRAVVSHETAGELLDIPNLRRGVAVVTVHTRTTHQFPGVTVHRSHDLDDLHLSDIRGIPVTTLARTCVDLAGWLGRRQLDFMIDDLIAGGRLSLPEVQDVVGAVCRRGRRGSAAMKEYLSLRVGNVPTGSALERMGRRILEEAGLPAPVGEFPIPWAPNRRFDDAYPLQRLALEWDSRRYHMQLDSFDNDRERDRAAVVHGWRVLRFTWRDVTERPQAVASDVAGLLGHR